MRIFHVSGRFGAAEVGPQTGAQAVGDDDVEEGVERGLALLLGDVSDAAALEPLGLRRERFDHFQPFPAGQVREHARFG